MTDEPQKETSPDRKLDELEQRLNAIEAKNRKSSNKDHAEAGASAGYQALGELIGGIFVGLGLGWLSDTYLGTKPWGMIVGVLIGLAGSVYLIAKSANKSAPDDDASKKD